VSDAALPPHALPPPADPAALQLDWLEFHDRRAGMIHAMSGGLWLHRHLWKGRRLAHLVSSDRARLLAWGERAGIPAERLQFHPLKDPRDGIRRDAWHWDLGGPYLPLAR
jgi:hypothetical protein